MYVCMYTYVCHMFCNTSCSTTMWVHVLCNNYVRMGVCECVHGRGSQWALVRSEFTVLMACGKKLPFSLSVLAAWLRRSLPDHSSWNSLLLGWWGSFMILQALIRYLLECRSCRVGSVVPIVRSAECTTLCRALRSWEELLPNQAVMVPGQDALHRTSVERLKNPPGDSEFPQLPEVVEVLRSLCVVQVSFSVVTTFLNFVGLFF